MSETWTPTSWQDKPVTQQPQYEDMELLDSTVSRISKLPPIVTSWEIEKLKDQLSRAAVGEAFVLQGGDCCETFDDCEPDVIVRKLKVLMQMSLVLVYASKKSVVRIGRIGGQYAKPRSADHETRDGQTFPSYRGDIINQSEFSESSRKPDPTLLLKGYERAALTVNFLRGLIAEGFADLHYPEYWDLDFVHDGPRSKEYRRLLESLGESIRFLEAVLNVEAPQLQRVDFYTSHEGLHLLYEQAQTRTVPRRQGWYNLSTHMPWIGDRTRAVNGAHVEYFRGIQNPIGVKIGPNATTQEIEQLVTTLNPDNEPGRLVLIHRYGADKIKDHLGHAIEAVQCAGQTVVWSCDPMHGNTVATSSGFKTRGFDNILSELQDAFAIHRAAGSHLGGVHLELTGDDVTECTGGAGDISEEDLKKAYRSNIDPRLNYNQAMEIAFLIAAEMAK